MIEKPHRTAFVPAHRTEHFTEAARIVGAASTNRRSEQARVSTDMPDRPKDMTRFDQLLLTTLALNIAQILWTLPIVNDLLAKEPASANMGMSLFDVFSAQIGALLFVLGLWFFASRLRSNIARWIMTLFALGTLNTVATQLFMQQPAMMTMPMAIRFLAMSGAVLGLCAVWFLHTSQSRAWFAYGR
jgi:VIT1/CCC1 family predicted Fe2+/Mn2+ transporter